MIKNFLDKIPTFFKSFYFLASLFFVFWMTVMDSNDIFLQFSLKEKKSELLNSRAFYEDKILEVKNQREALRNNPELLEKLAREKYYMKKAHEDLYVIVETRD